LKAIINKQEKYLNEPHKFMIAKKIKFITVLYIAIISIGFFITQTSLALTTDDLLPSPSKAESVQGEKHKSQLDAVRNLPDVSIEGVAETAIKTFLGWSMIIALIGIVVAGIYLLIFEGDTAKAEKAKNVIMYLIIGALVVSIAYGIVNGIIQFTFF